RRDAADRGLRAHIAIARTQTAAMVLALSSPGMRGIDEGQEAVALAPIHIGILEILEHEEGTQNTQSSQKSISKKTSASSAVESLNAVVSVLKQWGIRTLGEFAALPSSDLSARLGRSGLAWQ